MKKLLYFLIILFFVSCNECEKEKIYYQVSRSYLYSVENNLEKTGSASGSWFAGIGTISYNERVEKRVYVYQRTSRGTLKFCEYNFKDVEFQFTNSLEKPYIEKMVEAVVHHHEEGLDTIVDCPTGYYSIEDFRKKKPRAYNYIYIIHIPEGSIYNEYKINAFNRQNNDD